MPSSRANTPPPHIGGWRLPKEIAVKIDANFTFPDLISLAHTCNEHREQILRFLKDNTFLKSRLGSTHPLYHLVPASDQICHPEQLHWLLLAWQASCNQDRPLSPLLLSIASGAPERLITLLEENGLSTEGYPRSLEDIVDFITTSQDVALVNEALLFLERTLFSSATLFNPYGPQDDNRLALRVINIAIHLAEHYPATLLRAMVISKRIKLIETMRKVSQDNWGKWVAGKSAQGINALQCGINNHVNEPLAVKALFAGMNAVEQNFFLMNAHPVDRPKLIRSAASADDTLSKENETPQTLLMDLLDLPAPAAVASLLELARRLEVENTKDCLAPPFANPTVGREFINRMNAPGENEYCNHWLQLALSKPGQQILRAIWQIPAVIDNLINDADSFSAFITALFMRPTSAAGSREHFSALHFLTYYYLSPETLLTLIQHPRFLSNLMENDADCNDFMATLSVRPTFLAGNHTNEPPWLHLTKSKPGRTIILALWNTPGFLDKLMETETHFIRFMKALSTSLRLKSAAQNAWCDFPGWLLLACDESVGHEVLLKLWDTPAFQRKLMESDDTLFSDFIQAMSKPITLALSHERNRSVLTYLILTPRGQRALLALWGNAKCLTRIMSNQLLLSHFMSAMTQVTKYTQIIIKTNEKKECWLPSWGLFLSADDEGLIPLKKLLDHPNFLETLIESSISGFSAVVCAGEVSPLVRELLPRLEAKLTEENGGPIQRLINSVNTNNTAPAFLRAAVCYDCIRLIQTLCTSIPASLRIYRILQPGELFGYNLNSLEFAGMIKKNPRTLKALLAGLSPLEQFTVLKKTRHAYLNEIISYLVSDDDIATSEIPLLAKKESTQALLMKLSSLPNLESIASMIELTSRHLLKKETTPALPITHLSIETYGNFIDEMNAVQDSEEGFSPWGYFNLMLEGPASFSMLCDEHNFLAALTSNNARLKAFVVAMSARGKLKLESLSAWTSLAATQEGQKVLLCLFKLPQLLTTIMGDDDLFEAAFDAFTIKNNRTPPASVWTQLGLDVQHSNKTSFSPALFQPEKPKPFKTQLIAANPNCERFIERVNERLAEYLPRPSLSGNI